MNAWKTAPTQSCRHVTLLQEGLRKLVKSPCTVPIKSRMRKSEVRWFSPILASTTCRCTHTIDALLRMARPTAVIHGRARPSQQVQMGRVERSCGQPRLDVHPLIQKQPRALRPWQPRPVPARPQLLPAQDGRALRVSRGGSGSDRDAPARSQQRPFCA